MAAETIPQTEQPDVETLARRFGNAVADLPEYQRFAETQQAVENSAEAQEQIQEFEQVREKFMRARQSGDVSEELFRELQTAKANLQSVPVMAEHIDAQSRLNERLTGLNELISDPLAVDFGQEAGGCCQDD